MSRSEKGKSRPRTPTTIGAGEFKAHCLQLMDEVAEQRSEIVITKHGKPVAKLIPAEADVPDSFGALRGTITYHDGDLVSPDHEAWDEGAA